MTFTKAQIRHYYRHQRALLSAIEQEKLSQRITQHLFYSLDWQKFRTVHVFLSVARWQEVNTWPLIKTLWQNHPHLQVLTNYDRSLHEHQACIIRPDSELHKNSLGILQPVKLERVNLDRIDLMILPLLACDFKGYRLGYGQGFYDRLLEAKQSIQKLICIGIHFFPPHPTMLPYAEHDRKIDCLVTPYHYYNFSFAH